jgi:hypothetical protein
MAYTFAPVSTAAGLKRARLRLLEKGNKEKLVWVHREAEEVVDAYLAAAGIIDAQAPLFPTLDKAHNMTGEAITRRDMLRMVKGRCRAAGLSDAFCNHTFRGTGITVICITAGRSKPGRIWRITRTPGPRSCMIGVRIWRRLPRLSAGLHLSDGLKTTRIGGDDPAWNGANRESQAAVTRSDGAPTAKAPGNRGRTHAEVR